MSIDKGDSMTDPTPAPAAPEILRPQTAAASSAPQMALAGIRMDFSIGETIGHVILWVFLVIVTLGTAFFIFQYMRLRYVINKGVLVDKRTGNVIGKLVCRLDVSAAIGHGFLWALLVLVTLGFALPLYIYRVQAYCLSKTEIVPI